MVPGMDPMEGIINTLRFKEVELRESIRALKVQSGTAEGHADTL